MSEISNEAVKAIQESVHTEPISAEADQFLTRPVFAPPVEAKAETLNIHTLTGLVDYLISGIDSVGPTGTESTYGCDCDHCLTLFRFDASGGSVGREGCDREWGHG